MAANSTSIIITSTTTGNKKAQKSVTNINPKATEKELYTFAQALIALTTDTFEEAVRVDRTVLTPDASAYAIFGESEIIIPAYGSQNEGYYRVFNAETDEFVSTGLTWHADFPTQVDTSKFTIEINGYTYPDFPSAGFESVPRIETTIWAKQAVTDKVTIQFTLSTTAPDNVRITKDIIARFIP